MSNERFLDAILAAPDDDTPRLVYADWLEERGDPRGEFIRVQVARAALSPKQRCLRRSLDPAHGRCLECDLLAREEELLGADDARALAWFGLPRPWAKIVRLSPFYPDDGTYPYAIARRGFLEEVRCPGSAFLGSAEHIFRQHPVRYVSLTHFWLRDFGFLFGYWREEYVWRMMVDGEARAPVNRTAAGLLPALWPGVRFTLPNACTL